MVGAGLEAEALVLVTRAIGEDGPAETVGGERVALFFFLGQRRAGRDR